MKSFLISTLLLIAVAAGAQNTKVVAHRGYWDTPDNAQNSLTALKTAQDIPVYGSEFDVNMTADGVMVVSHGPKLESIPDVQKIRITSTSGKSSLSSSTTDWVPAPT